MYESDLPLLACPRSMEPLALAEQSTRDQDGEILEGELRAPGGTHYRISNGIPRFIDDSTYNASWDFKWFKIDRGKGINYSLIAPDHWNNIFSLNSHDNAAWLRLRGTLAVDLGCGVGQYSIRALRDHGVAHMVSVDLTR